MTEVDEYIKNVIVQGDQGSQLLAALCAPTLKNCVNVDIISEGMNGVAVLRVPEKYDVAVTSTAGFPSFSDPGQHAKSMVHNCIYHTEVIGALPVALTNVIDANNGEKKLIMEIGKALVSAANRSNLAIMNGELAILGDRVRRDANVSGTMIGFVPLGKYDLGVYDAGGIRFAVFNPRGKAVYTNSDGVGTKLEFNERAETPEKGLHDSAAMKADDACKYSAKIMVISDVVEYSNAPYQMLDRLDENASELSKYLDSYYILQHEDVRERLSGWKEGAPIFNISGTAVSTIDESRLKNPPKPKDGDCLIAIRGKPNPRSNGITDRRKLMVKWLGKEWHKTPEGEYFLKFLSEPSTIFYPLFDRLLTEGLATSVYHMSGGAYNGKLAKPLAKNRLYARVENLFEPDGRDLFLAKLSGMPAEALYAKWPMGNEGFITTSKPYEALSAIFEYGLEGRVVGRVRKAGNGITGVELAGIKGSNGKDVYFSGM